MQIILILTGIRAEKKINLNFIILNNFFFSNFVGEEITKKKKPIKIKRTLMQNYIICWE
jgi:hypothetical protein